MDGPTGKYLSSNDDLPVILSAVPVALVAAFLLQAADQDMFAGMLAIHNLNASLYQGHGQIFRLLLSGVLLIPMVLAINRAAAKSKAGAKWFLIFQIAVLSYFCQWLIWTVFTLPTSPLTIIIGLIVSFCYGEAAAQKIARQEDAIKNKLILALKEKELKDTHLQLVKQDEADRRLLASDLHDQVLNDLKSLRSSIALLKDDCKKEDGESERVKKLTELENSVEQTAIQIREVMENLTPSVLENLGLASAIDDLLRRSASRGKFRPRFKNDAVETLTKISKIEELLLFRIVQEALSNTIKHAQASKVEVLLEEENDFLKITILDDGRGIPTDNERGISRGLRYMRQRADLLGAQISWMPGKENKGCQVQVRVDVRESIR